MDINERLSALEAQVQGLQLAFLQSQRNEIPLRDQVTEITPWTATKTAYIGDTEIVFDDCPQGNLTVYYNGSYEVERDGARVTVYFDALEEVTDITISII
jgi:hypothetical protein